MATKTKQRATRTMYMHTLDGQPASFAWTRESRGGKIVNVPYIHFVGGTTNAKLEPSLRAIRQQARWAIRDAEACAKLFPSAGAEWANPKRYGYVRVEVPVNAH